MYRSERVIFDSLVSDFVDHDMEIRNVVEQSQQKLNCALLVDFL